MLRNIGFLFSYWFDKFTSVELLKMLTTFAIIERTEDWIGNLRFSLRLSEEAFGYYRFPASLRLKYKRNLKLKFLSKILKGLCDPLNWRFRILVLKFSFDVFFTPNTLISINDATEMQGSYLHISEYDRYLAIYPTATYSHF